jgi:hypothetical protein
MKTKKSLYTLLPGLLVLVMLFCFSCATGIGAMRPPEHIPPAPPSPPTPPEPPSPEKVPSVPSVPQHLMGRGLVDPEILTNFLLFYNPHAEEDFVQALAEEYEREAGAEGINHDVAFAQMCLETGFLRFGGLVTPDMNNFCGLGAMSAEYPGERFPDPETGVRAHIQHLKAYATKEPPTQQLVDPRYYLVRAGAAPMISGLAGTWAVDRQYAVKINGILERLYKFSFEKL